MKTLPASLQASLNSGSTTLCRCFRITRLDGQVSGFTDHDQVLTFNGVDYQPESGMSAAATEQALGLAVDTQEVAGALSSDVITDDGIALGLWDNAKCEIWVVDWSNVADRVLVRKGSIGEIGRGDVFYEAEIRGLAHELNQDQGRTFQRICDAVVGDARCGVDLTAAEFHGSGAVAAALEDRIVTVSGLDAFAEAWFTHGLLTWTGGANAGARIEIRSHYVDSGQVRLTLWQKTALPVQPGDTFELTAGCDKRWPTCREKFDNGVNFRGFPHMPGNDFALGVAKTDQVNDGGSFFV